MAAEMVRDVPLLLFSIDEHFGNADAVPQPPERCLSRQAGIVRLPQAVRKTAIPKT